MTTTALIRKIRQEVDCWVHCPRVEMACRLSSLGLFLGDLASRICDDVRPLREDRLLVSDLPEVASAFDDGQVASFIDTLGKDRHAEVASTGRPLVEALLVLASGHPWREHAAEESEASEVAR
ncbi:hypothetical protein BN12_220036 [Nostocoides japonicum T1-X7]|uniref:Uncharacterized protein n=1 Tax=Nostocoides japonicum T1-X7 TaxID=1194083 RepID=A0A077LV13_9MICO|nr:hypothetical protein [Tetrasphaera japonica]CCH77758.1 hypothetical protein BN12_220036 [Tetrasphaera japonica T1-X7]